MKFTAGAPSWIDRRIDDLLDLLQRCEWRGNDPFDLTNAPLARLIPRGAWLPTLLVSKAGSRLPWRFLRPLLRVAPVEDPKTYACAWFACRLSSRSDLRSLATEMADRLAAMATREDGGAWWGYQFRWPTMTDGTNERGASTIVPGAFAMLALAHQIVADGDLRHARLLREALEHVVRRHLRDGRGGRYIGYFTHSRQNTHNANLLGAIALTVGGLLFDREEWLEIAAECTATSLAAVDAEGRIEYNDGSAGDWTDCFHHIYVIETLRGIAALNPHVDREACRAALERLDTFHRRTFYRSDGSINYYPDSIDPIDPHNYAATAIHLIVQDREVERGRQLLARVDRLCWEQEDRYYIHRIKRGRRDRRMFIRWNQVWMFLALSIARDPAMVHEHLGLFTGEIRGVALGRADRPEGDHATTEMVEA